MTKKNLMEETGISKSTMDKMARGENISMKIIDTLCSYFKCSIENIVEYINDER